MMGAGSAGGAGVCTVCVWVAEGGVGGVVRAGFRGAGGISWCGRDFVVRAGAARGRQDFGGAGGISSAERESSSALLS